MLISQSSIPNSHVFRMTIRGASRHVSQGDRVRVYRNLNSADNFSVTACTGAFKGKVVAYAPSIQLADVTLHLSKSGRQRVLKARQKNVHFRLQGNLQALSDPPMLCDRLSMASGWTALTYNPYVASSLFVVDSQQVISLDARLSGVWVQSDRVYARTDEVASWVR